MARIEVDNDSRLGEFVDRRTLRFVRDFPHPAAFVWATLTDPAQFERWLWPCTQFEARLGGGFAFDISGQAWSGQITRFEPPRRMTLGERIAFDLDDLGDGCRLVVTLTRPPTGWSVMAIAGYHGWFGRLTRLVAGVSPDETESWASQIWQSVFPAYEWLLRRHVAGGAKVIWRLHFSANDATLDREARGELAALARLLADRPDLHVVVDGFGDDPCAAEESLVLCRARVEAAIDALVGLGTGGERIHIGYVLGNYHYLTSRDTEAGRAVNRRIELRPTY
jgi:uncharacterized protein YndB with AHSA1/START domain